MASSVLHPASYLTFQPIPVDEPFFTKKKKKKYCSLSYREKKFNFREKINEKKIK